MYECQICGQYARRSLAEIMRHIREVHRHFDGPVRCGIDGCPATPATYDGLRLHIYKKHRDTLITPIEAIELGNPNSNCDSLIDDHDQVEDSHNLMAQDTSISCSQVSFNYDKSLEAARFILKIRDGRRLTQTTTDGIIKDIQYMLNHTIDSLKACVMEKLSDHLTIDLAQTIQQAFSDSKCLFDGLETQYMQEKFIQEHFNYVVSI